VQFVFVDRTYLQECYETKTCSTVLEQAACEWYWNSQAMFLVTRELLLHRAALRNDGLPT